MNPLILFPSVIIGGLLAQLLVPKDYIAMGIGIGLGGGFAVLLDQKESWWTWAAVIVVFIVLMAWRRRKIGRVKLSQQSPNP